MTITINDHSSNNVVSMYVPKEMRDSMTKLDVVIQEVGEELWIRESVIMDHKTYKVNNNSGRLSYSSDNAKSYIGKHYVEVDGDYFKLKKDIGSQNN